ncbi:MAG TPA: sigma-70 family RNA polymerase sigma factor [Polyangiaceae bacterium]|nr:sigma-70 family RNA polymerase sigma factor [Polyangiaceae bacterium]
MLAMPENESNTPLRDEARTRRLFDAHFDFVWRFVRRLGVAEGFADDLAQQIFLTVSGRLHEIEPAREKAFLAGTALRVVANHRRTLRRRPEVGEDALNGEPADPRANPEELVEQRRERALLDRALDTLPAELRGPFVLYELEDASLSEIAELLGIPRGTVASRLRRARQQFQEAARELAKGSR